MPWAVDSTRAIITYAVRQKGAEMSENVSAVDSAETEAVVDSKAESTSENPSMEDSQNSKLFTLEEVDSVIKKRIDKQNAKHMRETDEMGQRISELEKLLTEKTNEAEKLRAASSRAEWAKDAHSKHPGIPEDVLTHELLSFKSAEDVDAFAAFLSERMGGTSVFAPINRDTGDPKRPKEDPSLGFIQNLFDRKDS